MRLEIKYFLENTKDEAVIRFVLSNLKKSGLDEMFNCLNNCNEETMDRWHTAYSNLYNQGENINVRS